MHLCQDLQHFSFGLASGLGKRSLHLWCTTNTRNYLKISNEAKFGVLLYYNISIFEKVQNIFRPKNIWMIFAALVAFNWVAVQELCEALMKLWRR